MVDRPVRVEAERLDQARELQVLLVDLLVGCRGVPRLLRLEALPVRVVLVVEVNADPHARPPWVDPLPKAGANGREGPVYGIQRRWVRGRGPSTRRPIRRPASRQA